MATYGSADLKAELTRDEREVLKPYVDTVGKITIGIGHNLTDRGISKQISALLFAEDVLAAEADLDRHVPWWRGMTPARQRALLNMCFNMGWGDGTRGLSGFTNTLALLAAGDYANAASHALQSNWAKQVGARAQRIAAQFING